MFVQLILGNATDVDLIERQMGAWMRDLAPGAEGWLGATAGKSSQGPHCTVVRFESEEAARANSERPEQGEWWQATEAAYEGPVTFVDSSDVSTFGPGGSDDAGFVQLMRAQLSDRARLEAIEAEIESALRQWRPDIIGGLRVWEPDDTLTAVDYFTSEEEARRGEAQETPAELVEPFQEWQGLMSDVEWYDLGDPKTYSP